MTVVVPSTKECRSCLKVLPETSFKLRARAGRQTGQRFSMCNRCLYVRYTRPNAEKKYQLVAEYKVAKGCADCGFNAHPIALEFDHLPGSEKKFNIGEKVGSYSVEDIQEEIEKCEVVCANCHAIRTYNRRARVEIEEVQGALGS